MINKTAITQLRNPLLPHQTLHRKVARGAVRHATVPPRRRLGRAVEQFGTPVNLPFLLKLIFINY